MLNCLPYQSTQAGGCSCACSQIFTAVILMPLLCAGPSVVNVYINYEKKFAFVEFRTGMLLSAWPSSALLHRMLRLPDIFRL